MLEMSQPRVGGYLDVSAHGGEGHTVASREALLEWVLQVHQSIQHTPQALKRKNRYNINTCNATLAQNIKVSNLMLQTFKTIDCIEKVHFSIEFQPKEIRKPFKGSSFDLLKLQKNWLHGGSVMFLQPHKTQNYFEKYIPTNSYRDKEISTTA